jgi:GTP pyrophosphokinase
LLHDAVEDGGPIYIDRIQSSFGDRVLQIVMGCTDGVPDASGQKGDWKQRKVAYINHLAEASDDVLLVSGSDKLHNARAIVSDMERIGDQVFERFTASKEQTIWYYSSLSQIFETRQAPMASSLNVVVQRMGNFG